MLISAGSLVGNKVMEMWFVFADLCNNVTPLVQCMFLVLAHLLEDRQLLLAAKDAPCGSKCGHRNQIEIYVNLLNGILPGQSRNIRTQK